MDCFDTILAYTNMQTKILRNFKYKCFNKLSVKFTRTSNSFYKFYMFLCLSTYDTPYKVGDQCPLYTGKVSRFFETSNSAIKYMIYM